MTQSVAVLRSCSPMRLALLTLFAPLLLSAQFAEERLILDVLERQQAAWNRGDIEAFMTGYERSDKILFVGSEIQRGYDAVLARYHRTYGDREKMGRLRFSDLEVRVLNDTAATAIGRYHLTRSEAGGGDASGRFSLVFLNTREGWRIVHDHTTPDAP